MARIYTRMGDGGTTPIHGRIRVPKTDIRIEANGTLDELNVAIGAVRVSLPREHAWQTHLRDIQLTMMTIMSLVATRSDMRATNPNRLADDVVPQLERLIDTINAECTPPECFILPGGTPVASLLHQARVITRRAERRLWALNEADPVPQPVLQYVNRLSDLFFIMARHEMQHSGCAEEVWNEFGYKRNLK